MVHIPYAGGNPAQLALLSGQVDLNFDNLATASANIKAGRLRAIAMTTARRSSAMPEVPTIAETGKAVGLGRFDVDTWFGLFGPAKLPADVTAAAQQGVRRCARRARHPGPPRDAIGRAGTDGARRVRRLREGELAKYEGIVKATGAKVE
jgi:tripartite-type tricarboxylate transporter receptor subunit TctC